MVCPYSVKTSLAIKKDTIQKYLVKHMFINVVIPKKQNTKPTRVELPFSCQCLSYVYVYIYVKYLNILL